MPLRKTFISLSHVAVMDSHGPAERFYGLAAAHGPQGSRNGTSTDVTVAGALAGWGGNTDIWQRMADGGP